MVWRSNFSTSNCRFWMVAFAGSMSAVQEPTLLERSLMLSVLSLAHDDVKSIGFGHIRDFDCVLLIRLECLHPQVCFKHLMLFDSRITLPWPAFCIHGATERSRSQLPLTTVFGGSLGLRRHSGCSLKYDGSLSQIRWQDSVQCPHFRFQYTQQEEIVQNAQNEHRNSQATSHHVPGLLSFRPVC